MRLSLRNLLFVVSLAAALGSLVSNQAQACASCGSGSDDPLILWPNETFKSYIGFSTSGRYKTVDPNGKFGTESGPTDRDSLTLAVAHALRSDLFFSWTMPFMQNRLAGSSLRSLGDPMAAVRWSWLLPEFSEPWRPQVQVMASHKFVQSRSLQESDRPDLLDAFGTGIPETKVGVDAFWGMHQLKGGFAWAMLFPEERALGRAIVFPGNGIRTTLTVGHALGEKNKIIGGVVREARQQRRTDGQLIARSESVSHSGFVTFDVSLLDSSTLRLSFSDRGRLFENKNMIASQSWSAALLTTWE
ncbi:MAG: hypothetical protein RJB13_1398 [Pseudomonadota bacterium]|jgi:hypothetical protein